MSWQKCDNAEPYSLSVPVLVTVFLGTLHAWLSSCLLVMALPSEVVVLIWLLLLRSWKNVRQNARKTQTMALSMDARDRILINEVSRTRGCDPAPGDDKSWPDNATQNGTKNATGNLLYVECMHGPLSRQDQEHHYTCCRSVKMPGCIYIELRDDYGKRLEILVFYRYHQREFYLRLLRHLAIQ